VTEKTPRRSRKGVALLVGWLLLMVLVGLFQWWHGDRWRGLDPVDGVPVVPVWLLVAECVLIAGGFALVSLKDSGGRIALPRYWAMLLVGVVSMGLMALMVVDVLRYAFFRCFFM
jgi:hypothetical protein